MDHLDDLIEFYRDGNVRKNQTFIGISNHVVEKLHLQSQLKEIDNQIGLVESQSQSFFKKR